MRDLLGGKGANLAEMSNLGLPVPPGFTISTEVCALLLRGRARLSGIARSAGRGGVGRCIARITGPLVRRFREPAPRLGALGRPRLDAGHDGHGPQPRPQRQDGRGALDRRGRPPLRVGFLSPLHPDVLRPSCSTSRTTISRTRSRRYKERKGYQLDTELAPDDWRGIVASYKKIVEIENGLPFPQDPRAQLWGAIGAVFDSWMNARAIKYRELHAIPASWGTAVNVQAMVFGNLGETSATGVAFTRNPSTGDKAFYGEFLVNAQGEDVVAGIRTPQDITEAARIAAEADKPLDGDGDARRPTHELIRISDLLERHYRDMQDMEFTIEKRQALDAPDPGRQAHRQGGPARSRWTWSTRVSSSREEAVARIDPASLDQLLHPTIDPKAARRVIATGLPASPGAACGEIVFDSDEAEAAKAAGRQSRPRPRRDLAGGHPRDARGGGHLDHARRHDLARGGRGARHGQALRLRRRLRADRRKPPARSRPAASRSGAATSSRSTAPRGRCSRARSRCSSRS